ncbi:hypothetical protein ACMYUJ_12065 [Stutzerimonas zhaodongensis]|uniref:hypothetical protein n=1 Tax=Stutzerimonas zhaodongensis TaxID=1176257 RepID=UPI0039EFA128
MKPDESNFDGDWNDECKFCGQPHVNHQIKYELPEGKAYLHRMPCKQEQHDITTKFVYKGMTIRTISLMYKLATYIWDKIPLKEEAKLLWQFVKHVYVSMKALILLALLKPK